MKRIFFYLNILAISLLIYLCENKETFYPPVITTEVIKNVTSNSAISNGSITYKGDISILAKEVCWFTEKEPTINDNISNILISGV